MTRLQARQARRDRQNDEAAHCARAWTLLTDGWGGESLEDQPERRAGLTPREAAIDHLERALVMLREDQKDGEA